MNLNAVDATLNKSQIRFAIKSAYPFKRFLNRFDQNGDLVIWYPRYYLTVRIEMDTYLKKGLQYSDLVAVDALRPLSERVTSLPEFSGNYSGEGIFPEPKISAKDAEKEAIDLIKGIVLSRNKLLKDYHIECTDSKLVHLKTFVVKLKNRTAAEWLYIDEHFQAACAVQKRPEILNCLKSC